MCFLKVKVEFIEMLKRSLVRSVVVCCLLLAGLAAHGHSQESKPEKNEQIAIHHLRSHPAQIAAETLSLALGQHAAVDSSPSVNQALMTSTLSLKPGVADTILATMSKGASSGENVSITITASLDHPKEH